MQPPIQKKKLNWRLCKTCLGVKKGQGFLDLVRALPCQKRRALSRQLRWAERIALLVRVRATYGRLHRSLILRSRVGYGVSFSPLVVLKPVSYGSVPVGRRAACLVKVAVASVAVVWAGLAAFGQLAKSSYSQPIWIWRSKRQHCRLFQKRRVSGESKSEGDLHDHDFWRVSKSNESEEPSDKKERSFGNPQNCLRNQTVGNITIDESICTKGSLREGRSKKAERHLPFLNIWREPGIVECQSICTLLWIFERNGWAIRETLLHNIVLTFHFDSTSTKWFRCVYETD